MAYPAPYNPEEVHNLLLLVIPVPPKSVMQELTTIFIADKLLNNIILSIFFPSYDDALKRWVSRPLQLNLHFFQLPMTILYRSSA